MPGTIQVEYVGTKRPFVSGKDLILAVIAEIGVGGSTNHALELVGPDAEALSVDEQLAAANLAVEAGSEAGLFPADETTPEYLGGRTSRAWRPERSDPDSDVARRVRIDLDTFGPLVALPHSPGKVASLDDAVALRLARPTSETARTAR